MELEIKFTLEFSRIHPINSPRNYYIVIWERHITKFNHLRRRNDIIRLHDYLTRPINSGLSKFINVKIKSEMLLVVIYWHMEVQDMLLTITCLGMHLR